MEPILNPDGTPAQSDATSQGNPADLIKDTDTTSFVTDVVDMSMTVPVIVDFWAPWCGPCKQLSPLIERLVTQAGGLVRMVKINVDENQNLAMQLRVQSIPAVFGFKNGQPVDGFVGALPESQIRALIERLTDGATPPHEMAIQEALDHAREALEAGETKAAAEVYNEILVGDPAHPGATAGALDCLRVDGGIEQARRIIESLPAALKSDALVAAAISAIDLAEQGSDLGDLAELEKKLAANENDHQARFDLSVALYGAGRAEAAIDALLELVRRNREWDDEAGRKQILKILEALGPTDPLTASTRRRLSSILFS
jgi:putative thioredoxin